MKKILLAGLVTGSLVFGVTGLANAQLVTNGGFEEVIPGIAFPGWTLSGNTDDGSANVFSNEDQAGVAHSGNYAGVLGGVGGFTKLSQSLDTETGGQFDLTFWLSNENTSTSEHPNQFQVSWGDIILEESVLVLCDEFPYTQYTFIGLNVKSGESTDLTFSFQNDRSFFLIDDISVTRSSPVPESTTMLLFGTGIAGLAVVGRRKKVN